MNDVKALVVEDTKIWQERIRRWLERYHCDVDMASNYQEAQSALKDAVYDLVTLDMALSTDEEQETVSASGGWELLVGQLSEACPGTAIYVISASFGKEPEQAFELNQKYRVRGFMNKAHFSPETLQKWVDEVRDFKEAGGRPDITPQKLTDIHKQRLEVCKKRLATLLLSQDQLELQKAKYGLDVPLKLIHTFEDQKKEIEKCQKEIESIEAETARLSQK